MKNISRYDFVFWNTETNKPIESYDIVYHFTMIIELINMGNIKLNKNEEIRSVASLPLREQNKYSKAIELAK